MKLGDTRVSIVKPDASLKGRLWTYLIIELILRFYTIRTCCRLSAFSLIETLFHLATKVAVEDYILSTI